MKNQTTIKILLSIGILASIITGLGEYLLHYLPEGPAGEVSMLNEVPLKRASLGHFLAIMGAPLYIAGYYGLKELFINTSPRLAYTLFSLGTLAFFIGGIWISSRYFGAEVFQKSSMTADYSFYLNSYEKHYQVLVWALRILVLAISTVYIILIFKNTLGLAKYLALCNPFFILLLIFSTLLWAKPIANHLTPIAMNVAHFIFFTLILYNVKQIQTDQLIKT